MNICDLTIVKPYNLNGFTSLFTLGFKYKQGCNKLEGKLQEIAAEYYTGKSVKTQLSSVGFYD